MGTLKGFEGVGPQNFKAFLCARQKRRGCDVDAAERTGRTYEASRMATKAWRIW